MSTKIKTFEEACIALGLDQKEPVISGMPEKHTKAMVAHCKLVIIAEALNEGWIPNWNNPREYKYYPWFVVDATVEKPSGSGLSYHGYGSWATATSVGSRLCFKSSELAEYAGKQFKSLYEEYFLIQQ